MLAISQNPVGRHAPPGHQSDGRRDPHHDCQHADLTGPQPDRELIIGVQAQLGDVGLAGHAVAIELHPGDGAELTGHPPIAAAASGTRFLPGWCAKIYLNKSMPGWPSDLGGVGQERWPLLLEPGDHITAEE